MSKFNSLAVKVPVILCIVTTILITIMLIISLRIAGNGISKSRFEGFENTVMGYSSVFDAWFRTQSYILETYASVPIIVEQVSNPNENSLTILTSTLRTFREKNACAIHVGIVDKNGIIIADSDYPKWIGTKFTDSNINVWNKLHNKEYGYGSVSYGNGLAPSVVNGELSFIFAAPVKYQNREIGYLYTVFNWREFYKNYIEGIKLGKTGGLDVIAPNLKVLMNTDYNKVNTDAPQVYKNVFDNNLSKGVVEYTANNHKMMGSYTKMKYVPWITSMTMTSEEIFAENRKAILSGIILGIITIAAIAIFINIFIRSITKPLSLVVDEAKKIERGDLTEFTGKIKPRKDEIGILAESFANMRHKLVETIKEVNEASICIMNASEKLAKGNVELSRRTEAQSASLQQTAASMEQMASTIKSSTEYSITGNNMMISSKSSIDEAGDIIIQTTKNIEEVYDASTKIKNITKIIEDIAFQTNILALNASVEAARAGEQGKGFAVVASEVRNLAQTTQSSVKDITDLVENAYDKINKATETAHHSQEIFADLRVKIDETAHIMRGISSAAVEQQSGVEQVNRAVSEMDGATQMNNALVNDAENASKDLVAQANSLQQAMKFFKL
ncbi:methyl-accepting chemotaxis protein [Brachyspira hyodysenteriae]|uniref:methyl-accepting chemotaxis protein n=1 Tax=Brachyspira hyodysenteriae TaxID=159 RepID=UPI0022CDA75B|nr:methyl-accepting chemotaxis protein [Brachyspira hyodysenteriae]MCZ9839069.1 methyl-accepting chemotaxis protein [Brachyspira hyodysenteriae]MCZ9847688.1 methyl-accepting chemotaxis protein [Brachyspira hyodysenteriae]MCZ9872415.1 methyl-accepting chemotaxis protein [Brachyspira hyodysenteriae]MCZ9929390.1 methyl-accepting chemotaxis protein [Brachyspira hyodysenteriae]